MKPVEPGLLLVEVRDVDRSISCCAHRSGGAGRAHTAANWLSVIRHPSENRPFVRLAIVAGEQTSIVVARVVDSRISPLLDGDIERFADAGDRFIAESRTQ